MSNFDYAGRLTETVLLGNLAMRAGQKIEWDAKNLKVTNVPEANQFVKREYRGLRYNMARKRYFESERRTAQAKQERAGRTGRLRSL